MAPRTIDGYEVISPPAAPGVTLAVVPGERDRVLAAGLDDPERAAARGPVACWTSGGRTPHPVLRVGESLWVVKSYRRGGWLSRWNRDRYLGAGRFFRELEVCALALRAGIPAVAPVALVVRGGAWIRAWLITPYIAGARTLADYFDRRTGSAAAAAAPAAAAFRSAGEAVRRMHRAGIDHCDLNLGNLLAGGTGPEAPAPAVRILDWDRARARAPSERFAFRNLLRLFRSGLKLQPDPALLAPCLRSFLRGYFRGDLPGLRRLRRYYRSRRFTGIFLHRIFWRKSS